MELLHKVFVITFLMPFLRAFPNYFWFQIVSPKETQTKPKTKRKPKQKCKTQKQPTDQTNKKAKQQIKFCQGKMISSWRSAMGGGVGLGLSLMQSKLHFLAGDRACVCKELLQLQSIPPFWPFAVILLALAHFHLWKVKSQLPPKKGKTSSISCFIGKHC